MDFLFLPLPCESVDLDAVVDAWLVSAILDEVCLSSINVLGTVGDMISIKLGSRLEPLMNALLGYSLENFKSFCKIW